MSAIRAGARLMMHMRRRFILFVVLAAALGTSAQQLPNLADGFAADKVYQFSDVDAVNLFNGNLIINIPIGQASKVSDGLSYQFHLVYNGNVWDNIQRCYFETPSGGGQQTVCRLLGYPSRLSNAGLGFLFTVGELLPAHSEWNQTDAWLYVSPDGGRHAVGPYGSAGSSFIRMRDAGANVKEIDFPDGMTHRFELSGTYWRLTEMRDQYSTGSPALTNYVRVTYTTWSAGEESGNEVDFTDSFGRTQRVKYLPGFADPNLPTSFTGFLSDDANTASSFQFWPTVRDNVRYVELAGPNGTTETYTFEYSVAVGGRFRHNDPDMNPEAQFRVLRFLKLPDGSKYSFNDVNGASPYDSEGKLLTFQVPTGGRLIYNTCTGLSRHSRLNTVKGRRIM